MDQLETEAHTQENQKLSNDSGMVHFGVLALWMN